MLVPFGSFERRLMLSISSKTFSRADLRLRLDNQRYELAVSRKPNSLALAGLIHKLGELPPCLRQSYDPHIEERKFGTDIHRCLYSSRLLLGRS